LLQGAQHQAFVHVIAVPAQPFRDLAGGKLPVLPVEHQQHIHAAMDSHQRLFAF